MNITKGSQIHSAGLRGRESWQGRPEGTEGRERGAQEVAGWAPEKGQVIPEFAQSPGLTEDARNLHSPLKISQP